MNKLVKISILLSSLFPALFFAGCNSTNIQPSNAENQQHSHTGINYACPMHPEVVGEKGDACPKCGMELKLAIKERTTKTSVTLATSPKTIEAGMPAKLTFAFKENSQHVPLSISHEMKFHLMVVNENLTWFRHIHPKEQADSSFVITELFPNGGKYYLFTDYKPQGGASTVDKKEVIVKGNHDGIKADFSPSFVSDVDDYQITLANGADLKTNRTQTLAISVQKDGKKLSERDIEPYLGATAHIAMISEEHKDFLHIHPISDKRFPIYAQTHIKKPGVYRIWVEFQTKGKVHTADFTVNVFDGDA